MWEWLDAVVGWLNHEYVWDAAARIPPCCPRHPHLVHEIAVLADQRRQAGAGATSDALEDWHRFSLPGLPRPDAHPAAHHCDEGHQPWPGKGRHTRHTDESSRAERAELFVGDVATVGARPEPTSPRLTVVDLDTGELRAEPTDW